MSYCNVFAMHNAATVSRFLLVSISDPAAYICGLPRFLFLSLSTIELMDETDIAERSTSLTSSFLECYCLTYIWNDLTVIFEVPIKIFSLFDVPDAMCIACCHWCSTSYRTLQDFATSGPRDSLLAAGALQWVFSFGARRRGHSSYHGPLPFRRRVSAFACDLHNILSWSSKSLRSLLFFFFFFFFFASLLDCWIYLQGFGWPVNDCVANLGVKSPWFGDILVIKSSHDGEIIDFNERDKIQVRDIVTE